MASAFHGTFRRLAESRLSYRDVSNGPDLCAASHQHQAKAIFKPPNHCCNVTLEVRVIPWPRGLIRRTCDMLIE